MERQLILRNVMTAAEWAKIRDKVHYRYEKDHYYSEFKHQETMSQRLDLDKKQQKIMLVSIIPKNGLERIFLNKQYTRNGKTR